MIVRVLAAIAALVLAAVGIFLVVSYANSADERALADLETQEVLVLTQTVASGTPIEELEESVETREVPQAYIVDGAVSDLADLEGQVTTAELVAGEQVQRARFASMDEFRARNAFDLPEDAQSLHQVTIPLGNPRALGGNIAPGDTVGVFVSIDAEGGSGFVLGPGGQVTPSDGDDDSAGGSVSMTHLALHKVLVVRVEGGYVASAVDEEEEQAADDTINVTLALEAPDAERLVFAMEFGQVWLSLEPEDASEEGTEVVVVTVPNEARNVYE